MKLWKNRYRHARADHGSETCMKKLILLSTISLTAFSSHGAATTTPQEKPQVLKCFHSGSNGAKVALYLYSDDTDVQFGSMGGYDTSYSYRSIEVEKVTRGNCAYCFSIKGTRSIPGQFGTSLGEVEILISSRPANGVGGDFLIDIMERKSSNQEWEESASGLMCFDWHKTRN